MVLYPIYFTYCHFFRLIAPPKPGGVHSLRQARGSLPEQAPWVG